MLLCILEKFVSLCRDFVCVGELEKFSSKFSDIISVILCNCVMIVIFLFKMVKCLGRGVVVSLCVVFC